MSRDLYIREEIRAASDIVAIVGRYVKLERSGQRYKGLCPFHNERTASFYVSQDRGSFYCFGCQKGGDVFTFVMEKESLSFPEAMRSLAELAHIEIPERAIDPRRKEVLERNSAVVEFAAGFYQTHLDEAREALQERLGIADTTARKIGLGYAPRSHARLLVDAAGKQQIALQALEDAGLAVRDKEEYRDCLVDRLVFPVHSKTGHITGFVALAPDETPRILVLNSALYNPRRVIFGLFQAGPAIRQAKEVFLVTRLEEAVVMHQAGIRNVVASPSGVLNSEQVQTLKQYTSSLVVVHGARLASVNAAVRTVNTALAGDMRVHVVSLPRAGVAKEEGAAALKALLSGERKGFVEFIHQRYKERDTPGWQDEARLAIATAVANIEDTLMRGAFEGHVAKVLEIDTAKVREDVAAAREVRALQFALEFYQDQFSDLMQNRQALRALQKEEINDAVIQSFGLGFAPDRWDALVRAARAGGIEAAALQEAGLVVRKYRDGEPFYYDVFRGRVVLPVVSASGSVKGIYGVGVSPATTDRNNHRPQETQYEKDACLFGLYQSKDAMRARGEALVVQSFWDVLALHAAGVRHVVAPAGGRLTRDQAVRLRRYAPQVVLIYETDDNRRDIRQKIDLVLSSGLGADVLFLHERDCQALIQEHGADAFGTYLREHRRDFVRFVLDPDTDSGGLKKAVRVVNAMIDGIADPARKAHYREIAALFTEKVRIYGVLEYATRLFARQLDLSGGKARDYLSQRGLNESTVRDFEVGYAPDRWDSLIQEATRTGISEEILEKSGLAKRSKEGTRLYDRFRGRVIFPIHDLSGKVIGFGGRVLEETEHAPKYLNSPETLVYKKSRALYGLYQSTALSRLEQGEVILVEGYTDVLALHQAGVTNVVACCGTALTSDQVRILRTFAEKLLLIYDADEAGARAALRAIDLALEGGMMPYAVALPEGEDPDSYVRRHRGEGFTNYIDKHRKGFVDFLYDHYSQQEGFSTPEGKADSSRAVLASIGRMGGGPAMEEAIQRASRRFGLPVDALKASLGDKLVSAAPRTVRQSRRGRVPRSAEGRVREMLSSERELLRIMLNKGDVLIRYVMKEVELEESGRAGPDMRAFIVRLLLVCI